MVRRNLADVLDDVEPVDPGRAGVRPEQGGQHPGRGGLAGAVGAQHAEHRARACGEVHLLQGLGRTEGLAKASGLDDETQMGPCRGVAVMFDDDRAPGR
jgi:hypothetical protein